MFFLQHSLCNWSAVFTRESMAVYKEAVLPSSLVPDEKDNTRTKLVQQGLLG